MGSPHIVMLPYPAAQGHVIPLMELAQTLAKHKFKITFVNTNRTHQLIVDALGDESILGEKIRLVSISDGSETSRDKDLRGKTLEGKGIDQLAMARSLEKLIEKLNGEPEGEKVSCIIADQGLGWAMEMAKKLEIKRAAFLPAAAAMLVLGFSIPRLIDEGVIDEEGTPVKNQAIRLSPSMPSMNTYDFVWARFGNSETQKLIFKMLVRNNQAMKQAHKLICNSAQNLEPGAFASAPEITPIGPLMPINRPVTSAGHFWKEDSTCLKWLDEQKPNSVIYIAFGSITTFELTQFQELALGIELTHKPFLWVVRPGITNGTSDNVVYPEGFLERVGCRGKIVEWAPQKKVLSHRSIACFVSHCGWNSTIEGVVSGVPFLCWPYFADQFTNRTYICDIWKVGLGFEKDERGVVTREGIRNTVEQLLGDVVFKERSLKLREETIESIKEGGSSFKNLNDFVEWIKGVDGSS